MSEKMTYPEYRKAVADLEILSKDPSADQKEVEALVKELENTEVAEPSVIDEAKYAGGKLAEAIVPEIKQRKLLGEGIKRAGKTALGAADMALGGQALAYLASGQPLSEYNKALGLTDSDTPAKSTYEALQEVPGVGKYKAFTYPAWTALQVVNPVGLASLGLSKAAAKGLSAANTIQKAKRMLMPLSGAANAAGESMMVAPLLSAAEPLETKIARAAHEAAMSKGLPPGYFPITQKGSEGRNILSNKEIEGLIEEARAEDTYIKDLVAKKGITAWTSKGLADKLAAEKGIETAAQITMEKNAEKALGTIPKHTSEGVDPINVINGVHKNLGSRVGTTSLPTEDVSDAVNSLASKLSSTPTNTAEYARIISEYSHPNKEIELAVKKALASEVRRGVESTLSKKSVTDILDKTASEAEQINRNAKVLVEQAERNWQEGRDEAIRRAMLEEAKKNPPKTPFNPPEQDYVTDWGATYEPASPLMAMPEAKKIQIEYPRFVAPKLETIPTEELKRKQMQALVDAAAKERPGVVPSEAKLHPFEYFRGINASGRKGLTSSELRDTATETAGKFKGTIMSPPEQSARLSQLLEESGNTIRSGAATTKELRDEKALQGVKKVFGETVETLSPGYMKQRESVGRISGLLDRVNPNADSSVGSILTNVAGMTLSPFSKVPMARSAIGTTWAKTPAFVGKIGEKMSSPWTEALLDSLQAKGYIEGLKSLKGDKNEAN